MARDTNDQAGPPSERVRVRRKADRGSYDRALVHAILDEALLCRVGFVDGDHPFVLPTLHVRVDDTLYIHGSHANRMLKLVAEGTPVCLEATVVDSIVLGRSVFENSMNYRSVVVLGRGEDVVDLDVKNAAMVALVERVMPGRTEYVRPLTSQELRSTRLVSLPLDESSAKVRTGPAIDKEADYALPVWAGEVPLRVVRGTPVADPRLLAGVETPDHVLAWGEGRRGV